MLFVEVRNEKDEQTYKDEGGPKANIEPLKIILIQNEPSNHEEYNISNK